MELNGQSCIGIESIEPKKQIISSRSFSERITNQQALSESICSHVAKAASKLRKQDSVCAYITVFAKSSPHKQNEPYVLISGDYHFITPTSDTRVMVTAAREVLKVIYKEEVRYAKAGVMLLGICQHDEVQLDLFAEDQNKRDGNSETESTKKSTEKRGEVTAIMDALNKKYGQNSNQQAAVFIASEGIKDKQSWQMSRNMLSPCYTTNINQLPKVH